MAANDMDKERAGQPTSPQMRRQYQTPALRRIGSVRELTLSGVGSSPDGPSTVGPKGTL